MYYTLMHKDVETAVLDIDTEGHLLNAAFIEGNEAHLPVGVHGDSKRELTEWWQDRAIPSGRLYIQRAVRYGEISGAEEILVRNYGLSMTDCYWVRPEREMDLVWDDVSLFSHWFTDDHAIIAPHGHQKRYRGFAPGSSEGELEKVWVNGEDGEKWLVKGNYADKIQQSLNEVYASRLMDALGWEDHVAYELVQIVSEDQPSLGCQSLAYTSEHREEVSFWQLLKGARALTEPDLYERSISLCASLGLAEDRVRDYLEREILLDWCMMNTDRHMRNISLLRDPDSLEYVGFSPMIDFGSSMLYRVNDPSRFPRAKALEKLESHSFNRTMAALLRHVRKGRAMDEKIFKDRALFDGIYRLDVSKPRRFYERLFGIYCHRVELAAAYLAGGGGEA